jgi:MYXO-CTERM domain-containing protein
MISELLSLGADVFEQTVPDAERHPKPPELPKDQEKAFKETLKGLKPKEKKEHEKAFKQDRITVVERQALLARNKYVVSRLHYRYDAKNLPSDPTVGPATAASGGTAQPKGKDGEASSEVKLGGDANKLQIRYNNFHPWVPVIECQQPDRYRWGKAGRDYRGLRKTWIADDLSRKSHTQIDPAKVVMTPVPDLALGVAKANPTPAASASATPGATADKSGKCSVSTLNGAESSGRTAFGVVAMLGAALGLRRRRSRL